MWASARASRWAVLTPGLSSDSTSARTSATTRPARRIVATSAGDLRVTVIDCGPRRGQERVGHLGHRPAAVDRAQEAALRGSSRRRRAGRPAGPPGGPRSSRSGRPRAGSAASRRGRRCPGPAAGGWSRCRRGRWPCRSSGPTAAGRAPPRGPRSRGRRRPGPAGRRAPRPGCRPGPGCAGKPSRIAPTDGVRLGQPVEEHLDGDRVGHELAALHVPAGLEADRGALEDGGPEEITGGDVGEAESIREDRRLGTLAGAGGAEQDQEGHRMKPS